MYNVVLKNGEMNEIKGEPYVTNCGSLQFKNDCDEILVIFAPGTWSLVEIIGE
jgi:hypothetical protein